MQIKPLFKVIVNAFFPNACACCGRVIPEGEFFCDYCFCMLEHTDADKLCLKCGAPKGKCECKNRVFNFDGLIAPYFNSGAAKEAMYAFKFRRKEYISEFFAEQMALCVRQCYHDVHFDAVCFVPAEPAKERKRGYNQSLLLAVRLAEIVDLPVYANLLFCHRKKEIQHLLSLRERLQNIKNIYYTKKTVTGKTLLLVDDIKTTGATLNECAKQLLLAGADRVYCVTGLITERGKKNGN